MNAPDRRQFQPLIFPHFSYIEAEPKQGIDYKAAYELRRIDCMRLARMGMGLIDALSAYAPEPFKSEPAQKKHELGQLILEM